MAEEKSVSIILAGILIGLAIIFTINSVNISNVENLPISEKGNVEVEIQDQYSPIIDLKLTRFLDNITILENTSIDDLIVNISTTGTIPSIDDSVCFKENQSFYQGEIINVVSLGGNNYQITLDSPLDFAYTINGGCSLRDSSWARDGSTTPLYYVVSPAGLNNQSWDITRVILVCLGDGIGASDEKPDLSSFFTTEPITNGLVFREVNGITKNIFTVRDNFHLTSEAYDLSIYDKNRFGFYAVTSRRTFNGADKNGVTIRLNSETSDSFQLIVRDDLTDMKECHAVAQGHLVE